jgi:hypothetical protein
VSGSFRGGVGHTQTYSELPNLWRGAVRWPRIHRRGGILSKEQRLRAYLVAFALTALIIGLPLFFAGEVRIGCTVTNSGGTTRYTDCGGADALVLGGEILIVASIILFAASFIPNEQSRYK